MKWIDVYCENPINEDEWNIKFAHHSDIVLREHIYHTTWVDKILPDIIPTTTPAAITPLLISQLLIWVL